MKVFPFPILAISILKFNRHLSGRGGLLKVKEITQRRAAPLGNSYFEE